MESNYLDLFGSTKGQHFRLGLGLDKLPSVLLIWRPKMCYPMQNNIGCIYFVEIN